MLTHTVREHLTVRSPGRRWMVVEQAQVGAEFIAAHLGEPAFAVVEVDVSPAKYKDGHIPGAVLWDAYADLRDSDYRIVPAAELTALIQRSGIGPDTTVVTYGYAAHLGYWLLRSLGHERVKLMDGPRDRWIDAGHPWSTEPAAPEAAEQELGDQHSLIASTAEVGSADQALVLLDVRSEAEFSGERFWPSGAPESRGRPGHIPGAVHLPIDALRTSDSEFRGADEMRAALEERGISPTSPIVTYCTIGNRAAQAWFALTELLGYEDVRVYYDSYVDWGMQAATPIER